MPESKKAEPEAEWKASEYGDIATMKLGFVSLVVKRNISHSSYSPPPADERYICYIGQRELDKRHSSREAGQEYVMQVADVFLGQALRRLREAQP